MIILAEIGNLTRSSEVKDAWGLHGGVYTQQRRDLRDGEVADSITTR